MGKVSQWIAGLLHWRKPVHQKILSRLAGQRAIALLLLLTFMTWGIPSTVAQAREQTPDRSSAIQPYIDGVLDRVTEFTLDNGMTFIVFERHQAPVISFMTYVNVGAAQEPTGQTGVAHYLEHLAFKGTDRIGTENYEAEKVLLDEMDQVFQQLQAAQAAGDEAEIARLQAEFEALKTEASQYVVQNQFGQIVEREGGVGLNATTSADATRYFYSFPANKLELWMSLESERFLEPVFREFYEEKDVILEERRMRTDNSPIGRMIEAFLETGFKDHPYGRPIIGYEADIRNLTRQNVTDFFETHYVPSQMIVSIVGDVDTDEVRDLAETYFGRYEARPYESEISVPEIVQTEPAEITLTLPSEPWYLQGYHRPSIEHPDHAVYQMIEALLMSGRTSRLYKALVEQQVALDIGSSNGFPGDRYSTMMLLYGLTAPGHTVDEVATILNAELDRLKTEPVTVEELDRVKTQARAGLLRTLSSNRGMASLLPEYQAKTGSWRNLFEELKKIEAVTVADVQRVAQETFRPDNLTVGKLLSDAQAPPLEGM